MVSNEATLEYMGELDLEEEATLTHEIEVLGETQHRISEGSFYIMLNTALIFDFAQIAIAVISFVLGLGPIGLFIAAILNRVVWLVGWITFTIWFRLKNLGIFTLTNRQFLKRFGKRFLIAVAGFIPGLGTLPDFTILVIMVYAETRTLDNKRIQKVAQALDELGYDSNYLRELLKQ
ncbi:hypothetical protein CL654_00960 [bacterium]|nr:hypothetical protein [bacterium]|tara:strand:+ start:3789 stop:4319 length:531 start_codon:yes stop_codon:yes gene_type:complete